MPESTVSFERLRQAARGGDPVIGRGEAFALIAESSASERESVLAGILQDERERISIRSAAAASLGRIRGARAEEALLVASRSSVDANILSQVLRSLGQIGGAATFQAIDALALPASHPSASAARFAAALISHRLGLAGHDLPVPREDQLLKLPAEGLGRLEFSSPSPAQIRKIVADLRRPYGLGLDLESAVQIQCAGSINTVVFNQEFKDAAITQLLHRKAVFALVALESPESGESSVSYIVLTTPVQPAGSLQLGVPRCSGRLALAGLAQVSGSGLRFSLRVVSRPGARAIEVGGTLENGRLSDVRAAVANSPQLRRAPSRVRIGT
jgi:hypothetical protein